MTACLPFRSARFYSVQNEDDQTELRITNEFNAIFRVDTAAGEKYVLRVTLPAPPTDLPVVEIAIEQIRVPAAL